MFRSRITAETSSKKLSVTLGKIDCLVLNAGISIYSFVEDITDTSVYRKILDVDFYGSIWMAHYGLKYLKESHGRILVVSSLLGKYGMISRAPYCAAKWALHGFFNSLRCEVASKYGMSITIVCPGAVQTQINQHRIGGDGATAKMRLKTEAGISAQKCATRAIASLIAGEREVVLQPMAKIMEILHIFFPKMVDRILIKGMLKSHELVTTETAFKDKNY